MYSVLHPLSGNGKSSVYRYIHTYIIGHYNPSARIIDLVSHTTYVVCVNFIHKWRDLQVLKSTPNDRFFEKLFTAVFILALEFLAEICREEIAEERLYVFCLMSGLGLEPWLYVE